MRPAALAYVVCAHRHAPQVVRLVRRLQAPGTAFLIHLDRTSGATFQREVSEGLRGVSDVHMLPRHRVRWAGFSVLAAMLEGVRRIAALRLEPHHTVFLTGQDYPIKPPSAIAEAFADAGDLSFLQLRPLPVDDWPHRGGLDHLEYRHLRIPRVGWIRLPMRRELPGDRRPWGGSQHVNLSATALRAIVDVLRDEPGLLRFFRFVRLPDELFFQTVLANSALRERIVPDDLRFVSWDGRSPRPRVLGLPDLDALRRSHALYARKFDDADVLDAIDEQFLDG